MGKYLNPGNAGFTQITNGNYVDKTGLIGLINESINTPQKLTCVSRPRRFGKSFAAQMLCAYYDCTCDSESLFNGYEVAKTASYKEYLNKFNVLYLDITGFISNLKSKERELREIVSDITEAIKRELVEDYPELEAITELIDCLIGYAEKSSKQFIFIIDEWDSVIREGKNDEKIQIIYLNLLREWFKNGNFTPQVVAAAYMTGILPIKKDGTESAISDFMEYTVLNPGRFARYTGFTETEVKCLCEETNQNFEKMKEWYDGYSFIQEDSIYNPYSVMSVIRMQNFESFWQKTSAAESLPTYINLNFNGLQDDIIRLIAGENIEVNVNGFANDVESFKTKDDVLTLMVHLGYLAYNSYDRTVMIPNKEVKTEFEDLIKNADNTKLCELVQKSRKLLQDTIDGDETSVCKGIEKIRESSYAPTFYNDEQSLRYVIKFAYIVCVDQYVRVEELPSGKGIADVVYIPKKNSNLPALVVELKWNKTEDAAIKQIKEKNYPSVIKDFDGDIVLVGINYDEKNKTHTCKIERIS
ncbi:AAA family ATPase [Pseudobutyrivibrio sp.]|uniref:AAA family ATPase n=1 Tax=Pseudobutyrivibrio sp. TaxID=2014367 RepID=UPI001E0B3E6A|nr:AAA family ATPase [Pseudobutyrivibrio sp.]MBE5910548.1 AAA family ATPase [Pseudobutyrivibrio sp.]